MERQQAIAPTDCEPIRTQFAQLLSGALDADSREHVRTHIQSCRACTLAFGQATADSMTPELTAKFSRPMPRPPAAVLTALGVRQDRTETVWTNLQALASGPAQWAKAEWENLRAAIQQWLQELVPTPPHAPVMHARAMRVLRSTEESRQIESAQQFPQLEIPVVDTTGRSLGRAVHCEMLQPPTMTQNGEFICLLRSNELGLGLLRCTVTITAEAKVAFTGEWRQTVPQGWQAMIRASGLPMPTEDVVLPVQSVEFEAVV